jgi:hypothetical protein
MGLTSIWLELPARRCIDAATACAASPGHPRALGHLGTLGTGNHFIELCLDEEVAACGSLKPAPDGRLRGAYPHLLCSSALPLLVVRSRRTLIQMPAVAWPRATPPQPSGDHRPELQLLLQRLLRGYRPEPHYSLLAPRPSRRPRRTLSAFHHRLRSRPKPPLWMKPGDVVEVEIDRGVGVLRNPIIAEA